MTYNLQSKGFFRNLLFRFLSFWANLLELLDSFEFLQHLTVHLTTIKMTIWDIIFIVFTVHLLYPLIDGLLSFTKTSFNNSHWFCFFERKSLICDLIIVSPWLNERINDWIIRVKMDGIGLFEFLISEFRKFHRLIRLNN